MDTRGARGQAGHAAQAAVEVLGDGACSARPCPRASPSSARCVRAGNPSPRARARRSGRSAGRSRSGRSRRSARDPSAEDARGVERARIRSASGDQRPLGAGREVSEPGARPGEQAFLPGEGRAARGVRLALVRSPPRRSGPLTRPGLRLDLRPRRPPRSPRRGARADSAGGSRPRSARAASDAAAGQSHAPRGSLSTTTTVAALAGRGCRRSATRAISPSRPREPEKSLPRS